MGWVGSGCLCSATRCFTPMQSKLCMYLFVRQLKQCGYFVLKHYITTYKRLTAVIVWFVLLWCFSLKRVWLLMVDCWIECCNSDHQVKYLGIMVLYVIGWCDYFITMILNWGAWRNSLYQAFCWWLLCDWWKACQHILWATLQVDPVAPQCVISN